MQYAIKSLKQWSRIFTDPEYWRPMVERICGKHRLTSANQIRAGYPGSHAVFLVDDAVVVKIFAPFWQESYERELELYHLLEPYEEIPAPKLLASGIIEAGQTWPYLVMELLPGERLGDVWSEIPNDNRIAIAGHLGQIVRVLHQIPVHKIKSMDTSRAYWVRFIEAQVENCVGYHRRNNSLPAHLLKQIPQYLADAVPLFPPDFSLCILHADITADHELLNLVDGQWQITGLIDFGDVEVGHIGYEFIATHLDAFDCDANIMRAFLRAYDMAGGMDERFNQRMMAYSLLHRYADFKPLLAKFGGAENISICINLRAMSHRNGLCVT